jgi:hypothetical protein
MMALSVPLSPQTEAALRQRAVATGKDPATVASELLTRILTRTAGFTHERLVEISGQAYRNFLASGLTDEQLGEELEKIKHEHRAKKRGRDFTE